ncbi:MAG: hypothetical protein J1F67_04995 [Muribaculaceae bacterium]|nr:hypothetical protein [Muribaculaceae bacterium]
MDSLITRLDKTYRYLYGRFLVEDKKDFAKKIGVSASYLSDAFADRNRKLTINLLEKIADKFPTIINKEYMRTGEGSVEIDSRETRPHFSDLPAAAGFMAGTGQSPNGESREFFPLFGNYSYSVEIRGNSMLPDIHSGDIAFCEILNDKNDVKLGEVYLVDTNEGAAIKVIAKEGKKDITLHSFNPEYNDYKVSKEDILRIARVIGITRKL